MPLLGVEAGLLRTRGRWVKRASCSFSAVQSTKTIQLNSTYLKYCPLLEARVILNILLWWDAIKDELDDPHTVIIIYLTMLNIRESIF